MNEQALRELCAEFGWTGVGADHDLARWLRDRLEACEEPCDVCGGEEFYCGECPVNERLLKDADYELRAAKKRIAKLERDAAEEASQEPARLAVESVERASE